MCSLAWQVYEALALLDDPVEIYMPDMKYGDDNCLR